MYERKYVKVDAQIEEECRRTISYLKKYCYPKLYCKKREIKSLSWIQLALQEEQLSAKWGGGGGGGEIK